MTGSKWIFKLGKLFMGGQAERRGRHTKATSFAYMDKLKLDGGFNPFTYEARTLEKRELSAEYKPTIKESFVCPSMTVFVLIQHCFVESYDLEYFCWL